MTSALPETTAAAPAGPVQQWTFGVVGMIRASSVTRIEKALSRVPDDVHWQHPAGCLCPVSCSANLYRGDMGYSVPRQAIYSSGLSNPFGLIKSSDDGRTWQQLGLHGEADFHLLAGGFDSAALYVFSARPNSRMSSPGLYYSRNDGAD